MIRPGSFVAEALLALLLLVSAAPHTPGIPFIRAVTLVGPIPLAAQAPGSDSVPPDSAGRLPGPGAMEPGFVQPQDAVSEVGGAVGSEGGEPPVPVLLVPGWSDGREDLEPLERRFLEAGWPLGSVMAVEFEDPVGSNRAHARTVAAAVRSLRATTGAPRVDVVAHSMGGLAVRRFLSDVDSAADSDPGSPLDATGVRKVVFLGTPHRGTAAAWLAWGEGGDEMEPGSPFLDTLNAGPFVPDRVDALAVRTPLDLRVIPGESAVLPSAENTWNVEICCPTHPGLLDHDETFGAVVEFLRDGGREEDGESG